MLSDSHIGLPQIYLRVTTSDIVPPLDARVVLCFSQAALTTRTSKDRLDLVTKLTDYVSDAIAEVRIYRP